MEFRLLGRVEVLRDGVPLDLGPLKQRALLALLLISANEVVSTDRIIDELWGEDAGGDRRNALWVNVSGLRSALEPDRAKRVDPTVLITRTPGYSLTVDQGDIDAVRFEKLALEGRALVDHDPAAASLVLSEALALWRGHALEEFTYDSFAQAEIARLEEMRMTAVEDRVSADLRVGRSRELVGELEGLVRQHPLRERLTGHLMLALFRSGRQAEALRAYGSLRQRLAEELGIDPSAEIVNLEERIVLDDPTLRQPRAATIAGGRPEPGLAVRGYELREKIGEGSLGVVYRAYQPAVGREVAVKIIRPELANDPEFIRRFEAEAQTVAHLEHPNIAPLFDYWREPDSAYLVTRLFEAGSLEAALEADALPAEAAVGIIDQTAAALGAAHRAGTTHGDIRPANILIDHEGNAYLADFGMSLGDADDSTDPFVAPEQSESGRVTPQADIYALAKVSARALQASGGGTTPDDPVAAVIARGTAEQPADRYGDVAVFLEDLRAAVGRTAAEIAAVGDSENPYRGLRAFQERDAGRFFGRERLVERLLARLGHSGQHGKLVALVGPSGAGKSSVVRAGLIPALRAGALPDSERWFILTFTPGRHPFESLEDALTKVAVDPPAGLLERIRGSGIGAAVRSSLPDPSSQLVLVVDQLEELFSHAATGDAAEFLGALADLATDKHAPIRVVTTLRADFYDHPLQHANFGELLRLGTEVITPMTADELERAITGPAATIGVTFEEGLVSQIVSDMSGQGAALPLLQYALTELFERRTGATITVGSYEELGGISAALARRAESIFESLDASARAATRDVFQRLVSLGEGSDDTRRRAPISELPGAGGDAVAAVLDTFGRHRLLSFDRDPATRGPTVEIAHEALLTQWRRLRNWLEDARADIRAQRRLAEAFADWRDHDEDHDYLLGGARLSRYEGWLSEPPVRLTAGERSFLSAGHNAAAEEREADRRRVRRLRRLVAGVAVALVVAVVAGGIAINQRNSARAATVEVELATLISRSAALSTEDPEVSVLLALEAHRRAPGPETERALVDALGASTVVNRVASFLPLVERSSPCPLGVIHSDGLTEFAQIDGQLVSRDLSNGDLTRHGPSPADCVIWMADEALDRRVAIRMGSADRMWFGTVDGPWEGDRSFSDPSTIVGSSFRPNHRLIALSETDDGPVVGLLDDRTGEAVGTPVAGGHEFITADASPDGQFFVASFATSGRSEGGGGRLSVIDGETGEELFHVDTRLPAQALAFDVTTSELLAGMSDGTLMTVDLATGEVVAVVLTTATADLLDLAVRPDGLIVVVAGGQVGLVDRRAGSFGGRVEYRNVADAWIRPDGSVLTISEDDLEVLDFESTALVEQAWPIDPFASNAFNAGRAGAMVAGDNPDVVELATGERTTYGMLTPSGVRFSAVKIYPETDGVWAIDGGGVVARWEGERMVEEIRLAGAAWTGTRYLDLWAALHEGPGGSPAVSLLDLARGESQVAFSLPAPNAVTVHPTREGGVHVLDTDGALRTYDASGVLVGEVETGWERVFIITMDPATGKLAIAEPDRGVLIVDPATGETDPVPGIESVANLGFGRGGELLAITSFDGTVLLWDVATGASAGVAWDGSGAVAGSPSWYDEATESIWVNSSGKLLQIPLNPERWVERACEIVGRDLTPEEWDRFVPGSGALQSACA